MNALMLILNDFLQYLRSKEREREMQYCLVIYRGRYL